MMEETYIINQLKENCCFVSHDFEMDLKISRSTSKMQQTFVLPDFALNQKGYVLKKIAKDEVNAQFVRMNNERFVVPELLFNPSDIGMDQAGIAEAVVESLNLVEPALRELFYANIFLVGGNALLNGFKSRLETDLRELAPTDSKIKITLPDNPLTATWEGAFSYSNEPDCRSILVSRQDYLEYGLKCCKHFNQ